jgi:MinD-like ATPase involved in chromosome partitioning or flagellar assembly
MIGRNPTIVVGHCGSGKTEFVANYAICLKEAGLDPVVADMDIVNPYFRVRELKELFESKGIRIVSGNYEGRDDFHMDMPALAAALRTCFEQKRRACVVDVGGDPAGAAVLAGYARFLSDDAYSMWMVVNANRPRTGTVEKAAEYIAAIERAGKLKINGIVNTTHMLRETAKEDILKGDALVKELSAVTGTEVVYTAVAERLIPEMKGEDLSGKILPIRLIMRPDWL